MVLVNHPLTLVNMESGFIMCSANNSHATVIFDCISRTRNKVDHEDAGLMTSNTGQYSR